MADAGLLPEYQFDQAIQDELRARDNWISARQAYDASLDAFKILLGLPPDAKIEPLTSELDALQLASQTLGGEAESTDYTGNVPAADAPVVLQDIDDENPGPYEIDTEKAVAIALKNRPDLRNALEKIEDAQRDVLIAEDSLRAELTIGGRASIGESRSLGQADSPNGSFRASRGTYSAPLFLSLPLERTRERNAYRNSLINLEKAVRNFQRDEDTIKEAVRGKLRNLIENRSRIVIQRQAVRLAERRVKSTDLLLQAGRAAIRDVLEAQNALLSAQNSLISAVVSYRINELELQRNLGVLTVFVDGTWQEPALETFN
jgi:outer membrane protein TolC